MFKIPENWQTMTPTERMEARFTSWMNQDIKFASPAAEKKYKERISIIKAATHLQKPARVPILPWYGTCPAAYGGITVQEAMYDYEKLGKAWKKFNADFANDAVVTTSLIGPGKVVELLDYKIYQWPGHGTLPTTSYQCIEGEYMSADQYDLLIADPTNFFMRYYLPKAFGALAPWQMLGALTDIIEFPLVGMGMIPFGIPPVQEAFKKFIKAGELVMEWITAVGAIDGESIATLGTPGVIGSISKAPFDTLGDTMRGTKGIMLDMYRQPDKLIEAMERLVPLAIEIGVRYAMVNDTPMVFIPLHKGADGFMSDRDFRKFYWPSFEKVLLGLIDQGTVPYVFVEGGYNQRLDVIADSALPPGHSIWFFDKTDMTEVKRKLGSKICFAGNVPGSMMKVGTPEQVDGYVKKLIDDVAGDGGFILSTGVVLDDIEPANLRAMIEAGLKYGVY